MLFEDNSFPDRPRFHMIYDGHDQIGHAKGYTTSPDLIHWTAYDNGLTGSDRINPVMGVGYRGGTEFAWGDGIKIGSTYHLFPSSGPGTTVHAQSTDLIHWSSQSGVTTTFDPLNSTDPSGIGTGVAILKQPDGITPVVVDGKYWMIYFHGFNAGSMYMAYTDATGNLLSWTTCNNGNPVLTPEGWEGGGLWTPSFVKVGDVYYIYYQAGSPFQIGFAKAPATTGGNPVRPDAETWTRSPNNPVITNTHGWDNGFCQDPTLRCFDGTYYLFYTGDQPWRNGFATSSSPEGPWKQYGASGGGPALWTRNGSPLVGNGIISVAAGQSIQSTTEFSPRSVVGYRARFYSNPSKYKWGGFMQGNGTPFLLMETLGDGPDQTDLTLTTYGGSRTFAPLGPPPGTFHTYEIAWLNSMGRAFIDHAATPAGSVSASIPSGPLPIQFSNMQVGTPGGDPLHTVDVDWVYVRKYTEPEPGSSIGAEEAQKATSVQLYVSSAPSIASACVIYPDSTWRTSLAPPLYQGANDWSISGGQPVVVYAVPQVGTILGATDMTFQWDPNVLDLISVDFNGSIFTGPNLALATWDRLGTNNSVRINAAMVSPNDVTIQPGNFIARMNFALKAPSHTTIAAVATDFRFFNQDLTQSTIPATQHQGEVKAYLGDVASPSGFDMGDGKLDFNDLVAWSLSYWSGTDGFAPSMANYKAKFDIGPTLDGYAFTLPSHLVNGVMTLGPDGKIDFEDLVIFSITYQLSHNGTLPKVQAKQTAPIVIAASSNVLGDETRVPVKLSGGVADVRAISLVLSGQFGKLIGVEKGELLQSYSSPVSLMWRSNGGRVYVDLAVMGLDAQALNKEGELVVLRFEGHAQVGIAKVDCRSSQNASLLVQVSGAESLTPAAFSLLQNYPNPFNPTTTIEYQLPKAVQVELTVYNILGERIAVLVNETQGPGYYRATWNGARGSGEVVGTGTYFFRLRAGDYTSVRKMLLMK
jgi:hypothetical protein